VLIADHLHAGGRQRAEGAYRNQLQRTVNLCLGACLSTVGLTLPAVLTIGLITGRDVLLGVDATGIVLIALTLLLSVLFSGVDRARRRVHLRCSSSTSC
jgi:Ca2+:H+ antiporter